MIEALVADCNNYLGDLEKHRQTLEGSVASGASDEQLQMESQTLAKTLLSYKQAAKFCKKHATKPKAKPKAQSAAGAVNEQNPAS